MRSALEGESSRNLITNLSAFRHAYVQYLQYVQYLHVHLVFIFFVWLIIGLTVGEHNEPYRAEPVLKT
jgi:hypothetical protein